MQEGKGGKDDGERKKQEYDSSGKEKYRTGACAVELII